MVGSYQKGHRTVDLIFHMEMETTRCETIQTVIRIWPDQDSLRTIGAHMSMR